MEHIIRKRSLRGVIALGAALGIVGFVMGVAVASIPSSGIISGCYSTTTGALRVVNYPTKHCASGERLIRWDQAGAPATVPITALAGTACSIGPGRVATLHTVINPSDGVVTLRCDTLLRVSGSTVFERIVVGSATAGVQNECDAASTCSADLPLGTSDASVQLFASAAFNYTCPGAAPQGAYTDVSRTLWQAQCNAVLMSTDKVVLTTP